MKSAVQREANIAALQALQEYQKLLVESVPFQLAKAQNNDMLPMSMWGDWNRWRKRIKEVDKQIERFYR